MLMISLSCFYVQGTEQGLELNEKTLVPDKRRTGRCSIVREQMIGPIYDLWS